MKPLFSLRKTSASLSVALVTSLLAGCSLTGTAPSVAPKVAIGPVSGVVHGGRQGVAGANVYVYSPSTTGYGGSGIAASSLNASTPLLTSSVPSSCGAGGAATATVDLTPTDPAFGTITAINVTMQGAGYVGSGGGSLAPTVTITDPTGTGATATAVLNANNGLGSVTITSPGAGYTAPVVTITPASTNPCEDANGNYYVSSDANGNFSLSGDYSCTTGMPVYIYTIGGDAGGGTPGNGSGNIGDDGFMSILGICGATSGQPGYYSSSTYLAVNELTTVAAAYATAGFATNPTHIGVLVQQSAPSTLTSSLTSLQTLEMTGLTNAFLTANNLYPSTTGSVGNAPTTTPNGNGTVPYKELNTLGNILADCVNSVNVSFSCETLLSYTPGQTDTAGAAIYIAQHPASNVASIYGLLTGNGQAYQPTLTAAPNDFSVSIAYTGTGLAAGTSVAVHDLAVDGSGNIWGVTSGTTVAASYLNEFSPLGVQLQNIVGTTGNGLYTPVSVAIDTAATPNVWVTNNAGKTISEFTTAGAAVSNNTINSSGTTNALSGPSDAEFDGSGNLWITNYTTSSLVKTTTTTTSATFAATATDTTHIKSAEGVAIAAGSAGAVFAGTASAKYSSLFTNADVYSLSVALTASYAFASAIDASGNVWYAESTKDIAKVVPGASLTKTEIATTTAKQYYYPTYYSIALDGAGNIFVPDTSNGAIEEFSNAGTNLTANGLVPSSNTINYVINGSAPTTGYVRPFIMVIDGSGNAWYNTLTDATLREVIGVATPVVTPLSYGVANTLLGQRP